MNGLVAGVTAGNMMAGHGRGTLQAPSVPASVADRLAAERNQALLDAAEATRVAEEATAKLKSWRVYANRLNAHIAAHKQSEYDLLDALKAENAAHPLSTIDGLKDVFDRHLAEQYAGFDQGAGKITAAEQKSLDEVGKGREDIK